MTKYDQGARWTFVHSNGTRTAYVMDRCMVAAAASPDGKQPGLAAVYALTNPTTGKQAQVSTAWLNRGGSQHSHWVFDDATEAEEAA